MARQIYEIGFKQCVVSENHPEGLWSNKPNYPKTYDSKDDNDDIGRTFEIAEAEYRACESTMLLDTNPTRAMQLITMERSDGRMIYSRKKGDFPVWPPEPAPEPEPEEPVEE